MEIIKNHPPTAEKIREGRGMRKIFSRLGDILIFALVLSMLTMAALYIGAARTSSTSAARLHEKLPSGVRVRGAQERAGADVGAAGWLGVADAAVGCDGNGGYAFAEEDMAKKLYAFAAPLISAILSESPTATAMQADAAAQALSGDFVRLDLYTPLPIHAIGLLVGTAKNCGVDVLADALILSFDAAGRAVLYAAAGDDIYLFDGAAAENRTTLAALAGAEALHPYTSVAHALFLPKAAPTLSPISLSRSDITTAMTETEIRLLFTLFGFNPEKQAPRRGADGISTVEPQGQMEISNEKIQYLAAEGSALPLSDLVGTADGAAAVFSAAAELLRRVEALTNPHLFGDAKLYLAAVGRTGGVYTLQFGLSADGVPILLDGDAIFLTLTATEDGVTAVNIRPCTVTRAPTRTTRFAADWQYAHAARRGDVLDFALLYAVQSGTDAPTLTEAEWYAAFAETEAIR